MFLASSVSLSKRPPEDDPPEAQAPGRGGGPVPCRAPSGESRCDVRLVQFAAADLDEDRRDPPDHPAKEG
ncbi:MAG TPA: hypothetical protein VH723_03055, partial [Candidatus Limnocylindrales bacterium]